MNATHGFHGIAAHVSSASTLSDDCGVFDAISPPFACGASTAAASADADARPDSAPAATAMPVPAEPPTPALPRIHDPDGYGLPAWNRDETPAAAANHPTIPPPAPAAMASCVRLTNWAAQAVATAVEIVTPVTFKN